MKNVQCLLAVCVALFCSILVYGQTEQEIEEKYGKPLKAYMVSNSIYMLPQYNSGQLYSVTLYCSRILTTGQKLDNRPPDNKIEAFEVRD